MFEFYDRITGETLGLISRKEIDTEMAQAVCDVHRNWGRAVDFEYIGERRTAATAGLRVDMAYDK